MKTSSSSGRCRGPVAVAAMVLLAASATADAQLQITELMYNSVGDDSFNGWEWIEVRNSSSSAVDLSGAYVAAVGRGYSQGDPSTISFAISNSVVPAGGSAVLYDAAPSDFDESLFRTAWGLSGDVPLIALSNADVLSNSGAEIGIWANAAAYEMDIPEIAVDGMTSGSVAATDNALVSLTYTPSAGGDGVSAYWTGAGGPSGFQDFSNWRDSVSGVLGATTSGPASIAGTQLNSTDDVGTPGSIQGGTAGAPAGEIIITEVMFNPASTGAAGEWEWVEVFNNSGSPIDFATAPGVLDDDDGARQTAGNVTSGSIGAGEFAVLYRDNAATLTNMQDAWGVGVNFIPVTNWPALGNSGDAIGFWQTFADYEAEPNTDGDETFDFAADSVDYGAAGFPDDDNGESIQLAAINLAGTVGDDWFASEIGDGVSTQAAVVTDDQLVHPGGAIGSPGAAVAGDYNNDGLVTAADFTVWRDNLDGDGSTLANRGAGLTGPVGIADYTFWKDQFLSINPPPAAAAGVAAAPEPGSAALAALLLVGLCRRRSRA